MLVRSVIYGWGFDFMRPFQKQKTVRRDCLLFLLVAGGFEPERRLAGGGLGRDRRRGRREGASQGRK